MGEAKGRSRSHAARRLTCWGSSAPGAAATSSSRERIMDCSASSSTCEEGTPRGPRGHRGPLTERWTASGARRPLVTPRRSGSSAAVRRPRHSAAHPGAPPRGRGRPVPLRSRGSAPARPVPPTLSRVSCSCSAAFTRSSVSSSLRSSCRRLSILPAAPARPGPPCGPPLLSAPEKRGGRAHVTPRAGSGERHRPPEGGRARSGPRAPRDVTAPPFAAPGGGGAVGCSAAPYRTAAAPARRKESGAAAPVRPYRRTGSNRAAWAT